MGWPLTAKSGGMEMRLKFKHFSGRRWNTVPVTEESTGQEVGHIRSNGVGFGGGGTHAEDGIEIYLFGGRYQMTVQTYDQCWGFIRGVEAVLDQMMSNQDIEYRKNLRDVG